MKIEGLATEKGTEKYTKRFPNAAENHFREANNLHLSSIGIGTYLGNYDEETDGNYIEAIEKFVESGGNVIDTAANYRFQRSERNIGKALQNLSEKGFERKEFVICTKGGYLPFDGAPPTDVKSYFQKNFVEKGIADFDELVSGSHCMSPKYLQNQLDQSLENMNLSAVDVYFIHNPESQLAEIDKPTFEARLAMAFERLEENRADKKLQFYGAATWNGFRVSPQDAGFHSLERMVQIAEQVGGKNHGFKFVQMPFNLAMPEAFVLPNQQLNGKVVSTLKAAKDLGVTVVASASILQGKLAQNVPLYIRETLGSLTTDALTSIQFARSAEGITTALVGMSQTRHVAENMKLAEIEPTDADEFQTLFAK